MVRWVLAVAFALIGTVLCGVAGLGWWRLQSPAVERFSLVAAIAGAGALALSGAFAFESMLAVFVVTIALGLSLPVPWAVFTFDYTGMEQLGSRRVAALMAVPVVVGLAATVVVFGPQFAPWFDPWAWVAAEEAVAAGRTFLNVTQWFALLYAGGLMLTSSGLLVWTFHRYDHLDSTTGAVLGTFGTVSWLSTLFGLQLNAVSPLALGATVALGLGVCAVAAVALVGPAPLFERVPAAGNVGPTTIIEELGDLVVVTDREGRVVETNRATRRSLDVDGGDVLGTDVDTLLGAAVPELRERETVALATADGRAVFDPTVSRLTDQHGHQLGYAVVLRDVTERTTRRQQLEVFNRVLRHNLGNNMTVIEGHADLIQSRAKQDAVKRSANRVLENSRELVRLSETVRDVENTLDIDGGDNRTRLAPLAEDVLAAVTDEYPGVSWQLDAPEGVVVEAHPDSLRLVLRNLVENAVEHNDSEDPRVWVRAEFPPDRPQLEVSVADDGPGIPDQERRTIERGNETQLQHGSGIGLWVVRWVVTTLGGRLEFAAREPRGTVVTVSLPAGREQPGDEATELSDSGAELPDPSPGGHAE